MATSRDTKFKTNSGITKDGRKVIKFLSSNGKESARAYQCCWGYYHNCYRTRIGMYVRALDEFIGIGGKG